MTSLRLDDDWFVRYRHRLLAPRRFGKPFAYAARGLVGAQLDRRAEDGTEGALAHLSPRHRAAVRQHMQIYRACLESFGLVPSDAIVNAAVQIEWLWYVTPFKRFYRDHLAHVMKVALIGEELLASPESPLADGERPLIERVAKGLADRTFGTAALRVAARRAGVTEEELGREDFWRDAVFDAVRIAGLLHDMAYPDDMAGKVARAAGPVRPRVPFEPADGETARHAIAAMDGCLSLIPFSRGKLAAALSDADRRAAEAAYSISHAPRAAYAILRMQQASDRVVRLRPFDAFVLEWAALGAMLHDLDKLFELREERKDPAKAAAMRGARAELGPWIDEEANARAVAPCFQEDPVSYVVALADQLQDFGRMHYAVVPRGGPDTGRHDASHSTVRSCYPCLSVEVTTQGRTGALRAEIAFDMKGTAPFEASSEDLRKTRKHKDAQAELVFGAGGWLRHEGLFESVNLTVHAPAASPAAATTVPFVGVATESATPKDS